MFLRAAARNVEYLGLLGVTHVLNTAEGAGAAARMAVNTSQEYYSPSGNVGTVHDIDHIVLIRRHCVHGAEAGGCDPDQYQQTLPPGDDDDKLMMMMMIMTSEVIEFLDSALASGGKVLVNCHLGVSRSAACVLAYLLTRHHMSLAEALDKVS